MRWSAAFPFLGLAVGVMSSPTFSALETSPAQLFGKRDVPMCGPSTGVSCGMNVCCSGANFCGVSLMSSSVSSFSRHTPSQHLTCNRRRPLTVQLELASQVTAVAPCPHPRSVVKLLERPMDGLLATTAEHPVPDELVMLSNPVVLIRPNSRI